MISIRRNDGLGVAATFSCHAKRAPASHRLSVARADRGPVARDLRRRKAVLRDPERQRALLEERRAVARLRDRTHSRGERDRDDGERDEDLD